MTQQQISTPSVYEIGDLNILSSASHAEIGTTYRDPWDAVLFALAPHALDPATVVAGLDNAVSPSAGNPFVTESWMTLRFGTRGVITVGISGSGCEFEGNTDTPFTSAIASLPTEGGVIAVTSGAYIFSSTVHVPKNVSIIGVHPLAVTIQGTGDFSVFNLAGENSALEFLTLTNPNAVTFPVVRLSGTRANVSGCYIHSYPLLAIGAVGTKASIRRCRIESDFSGVLLQGPYQTVEGCSFSGPLVEGVLRFENSDCSALSNFIDDSVVGYAYSIPSPVCADNKLVTNHLGQLAVETSIDLGTGSVRYANTPDTPNANENNFLLSLMKYAGQPTLDSVQPILTNHVAHDVAVDTNMTDILSSLDLFTQRIYEERSWLLTSNDPTINSFGSPMDGVFSWGSSGAILTIPTDEMLTVPEGETLSVLHTSGTALSWPNFSLTSLVPQRTWTILSGALPLNAGEAVVLDVNRASGGVITPEVRTLARILENPSDMNQFVLAFSPASNVLIWTKGYRILAGLTSFDIDGLPLPLIRYVGIPTDFRNTPLMPTTSFSIGDNLTDKLSSQSSLLQSLYEKTNLWEVSDSAIDTYPKVGEWISLVDGIPEVPTHFVQIQGTTYGLFPHVGICRWHRETTGGNLGTWGVLPLNPAGSGPFSSMSRIGVASVAALTAAGEIVFWDTDTLQWSIITPTITFPFTVFPTVRPSSYDANGQADFMYQTSEYAIFSMLDGKTLLYFPSTNKLSETPRVFTETSKGNRLLGRHLKDTGFNVARQHWLDTVDNGANSTLQGLPISSLTSPFEIPPHLFSSSLSSVKWDDLKPENISYDPFSNAFLSVSSLGSTYYILGGGAGSSKLLSIVTIGSTPEFIDFVPHGWLTNLSYGGEVIAYGATQSTTAFTVIAGNLVDDVFVWSRNVLGNMDSCKGSVGVIDRYDNKGSGDIHILASDLVRSSRPTWWVFSRATSTWSSYELGGSTSLLQATANSFNYDATIDRAASYGIAAPNAVMFLVRDASRSQRPTLFSFDSSAFTAVRLSEGPAPYDALVPNADSNSVTQFYGGSYQPNWDACVWTTRDGSGDQIRVITYFSRSNTWSIVSVGSGGSHLSTTPLGTPSFTKRSAPLSAFSSTTTKQSVTQGIPEEWMKSTLPIDISTFGAAVIGSDIYTIDTNTLYKWTGSTRTTLSTFGGGIEQDIVSYGTDLYLCGMSSVGPQSTFTNAPLTSPIYSVFADGTTIYAATAGGISFSTDNGATWTTKTIANGLVNNDVRSVWASGTTIYAATNGGLSKSIDGGTTWATLTGLASPNLRDVFSVGTYVYVATDASGLSVSANGGSTWATKTTVNGLGSNSIRRIYAEGSNVYAATASGLSISSNNGSAFSNKNTTNGLGSIDVRDVTMHSGTIYAVCYSPTAGKSICTSINSGSTFFTDTYNASSSSTCIYVSGSTLIVGSSGGGAYVSSNYFYTQPLQKSLAQGLASSEVNDIAVIGNTIFLATALGVAVSNGVVDKTVPYIAKYDTTSNSWVSFSNNIKTAASSSNCCLLLRDNVLYASINVYSTGSTSILTSRSISACNLATEIWTPLPSFGNSLGLESEPKRMRNIGSELYAVGAFSATLPVIRTTAQGLGSNNVSDTYFTVGYMYAGTNGGLSYSTNEGNNWINFSTAQGLGSSTVRGVFAIGQSVWVATAGGLSIAGNINTVVFFANRTYVNSGIGTAASFDVKSVWVFGNNIYAGMSSEGLSISTNGGTSFSLPKTTANGLGSKQISQVVGDGARLYIATAGGLSISTDGLTGNAFINYNSSTSGWPATNITRGVCVVGSTIYVATSAGLVKSTNGGTSWTTITAGLASINLAAVWVEGQYLFVSTQGSGMSISVDGGTTWFTDASFLSPSKAHSIAGKVIFGSTSGGGLILRNITTAMSPRVLKYSFSALDWLPVITNTVTAANTLYDVSAVGTDVYVTGNWATYNHIAKISSGAVFALGSGLSDQAKALHYDTSRNKLYVGGTFLTAGGVASRRVASWDLTTSMWGAFTSGVGFGPTIMGEYVKNIDFDSVTNRYIFTGSYSSIDAAIARSFATFKFSYPLTLEGVNTDLYVWTQSGGLLKGNITASTAAVLAATWSQHDRRQPSTLPVFSSLPANTYSPTSAPSRCDLSMQIGSLAEKALPLFGVGVSDIAGGLYWFETGVKVKQITSTVWAGLNRNGYLWIGNPAFSSAQQELYPTPNPLNVRGDLSVTNLGYTDDFSFALNGTQSQIAFVYKDINNSNKLAFLLYDLGTNTITHERGGLSNTLILGGTPKIAYNAVNNSWSIVAQDASVNARLLFFRRLVPSSTWLEETALSPSSGKNPSTPMHEGDGSVIVATESGASFDLLISRRLHTTGTWSSLFLGAGGGFKSPQLTITGDGTTWWVFGSTDTNAKVAYASSLTSWSIWTSPLFDSLHYGRVTAPIVLPLSSSVIVASSASMDGATPAYREILVWRFENNISSTKVVGAFTAKGRLQSSIYSGEEEDSITDLSWTPDQKILYGALRPSRSSLHWSLRGSTQNWSAPHGESLLGSGRGLTLGEKHFREQWMRTATTPNAVSLLITEYPSLTQWSSLPLALRTGETDFTSLIWPNINVGGYLFKKGSVTTGLSDDTGLATGTLGNPHLRRWPIILGNTRWSGTQQVGPAVFSQGGMLGLYPPADMTNSSYFNTATIGSDNLLKLNALSAITFNGTRTWKSNNLRQYVLSGPITFLIDTSLSALGAHLVLEFNTNGSLRLDTSENPLSYWQAVNHSNTNYAVVVGEVREQEILLYSALGARKTCLPLTFGHLEPIEITKDISSWQYAVPPTKDMLPEYEIVSIVGNSISLKEIDSLRGIMPTLLSASKPQIALRRLLPCNGCFLFTPSAILSSSKTISSLVALTSSVITTDKLNGELP